MTGKTSNQFPVDKKRDPDLINAEIAMKRAACKAREIARKAGISVVVYKDGEIVEEQVDLNAHSGH